MANDPFTSLQTPAPTFSEQQAIAMLRDRYGIEAALAPLASERDQNFLVTASDGSKYVLKFANASEPAAITDFQIRGLLHVARAGTDFQVLRCAASSTRRVTIRCCGTFETPRASRLCCPTSTTRNFANSVNNA
jgi:Ser/Thr protein kinase RdoA (MazF antagonist)